MRGIGLETTAADIVLGALTGIATRVAELTAHMGVTGPLLVDGGLSQSQVLLEAIQRKTGLDIHPLVITKQPCAASRCWPNTKTDSDSTDQTPEHRAFAPISP